MVRVPELKMLHIEVIDDYQSVPVVSGLMTTAEDDPDREHENQAEAPAPAAETPTGLQQTASGIAEAQAWKGQQIAKGWRKLVNALRRREERGG